MILAAKRMYKEMTVSAQVLEIDEKHKASTASPSRISDFTFHAGDSIPANVIVANPAISLYCLDDANRCAVFVETDPGFDLLQAPFHYMAQHEHARRLIILAYDEFIQLADDMGQIDHLVSIYNVGRSGSTLLSQIFGQVENVVSLSEPEVLTSCAFLREPNGSRDDELVALIRSSIRLLCQPRGQYVYAIKWRDWLIQLADLIHRAWPQGKNIFLYRNAETWLNSWHRLYTQFGIDFDAVAGESWIGIEQEAWPPLLPLFRKYTEDYEKALVVDDLIAMWLSDMDGYLNMHNRSVPFLALRFEDLNVHRQEVVQMLFDYCNIPVAEVPTALKAFERDSQEGTPLEGASQQDEVQFTLTEKYLSRLHATLQKHPMIHHPGFDVPNTYRFKE